MHYKKWGSIILLFASVLVVGCASTSNYYMVTDPASKSVYYTKKVKQARGGTASFIDDRSGANVTLQNSEIKEISKSEYEAGLKAPASTPAPAPAPTTTQEAAPAPSPEAAPAPSPEAAPAPSSGATPAPPPESAPGSSP